VVGAHPRPRLPAAVHQRQGGLELAARASAGEYFERLSTIISGPISIWARTIANRGYVHHPDERWFALDDSDDAWPLICSPPNCTPSTIRMTAYAPTS